MGLHHIIPFQLSTKRTIQNATILANQNSIVVSHALGAVPTSCNIQGKDDNANIFIWDTATATQITCRFQGGISQPTDTLITVELGV